MTGPIIQIPYLHQDTLHEGAGLTPGTGAGESLSQLARLLAFKQQHEGELLMARGKLALEQEKFDAEQQTAKDKKKQLELLQQHLTGAFQNVSTPEGLFAAYQQAIPQMAGAGENPTGAMGQLPELMGQIAAKKENAQIGDVIRTHGDLTVPENRQDALNAIFAINPAKATQLDNILTKRTVTPVNQSPGAETALVDQNGKVVGRIKGPPAKATSLDERVRQRAPALIAALQGMEGIEQSNPAAVNEVAAAYASGKLKFGPVDIGRGIEWWKGLSFTPDAKRYYMYANNYVEGLIGLTPNVRGSAAQIDLWKTTTVPLINEAMNGEALGARQAMRRTQLAGFVGQRFGMQDDTPSGGQIVAPNPGTVVGPGQQPVDPRSFLGGVPSVKP